MQMLNLSWHDYLVLISFVACIAGLFLMFNGSQAQADELEATEQALLSMSFSYWIVYCVAIGVQKICLPEWDLVLLSLKLTAAFSYFLTFACILSLPLSRLAVRHVED
ncbi:MAG: hypothetical protein JOZ78_03715 [Chroococcidiopsidaceae cyanobacterium CP_BM_ER_R8_30]|nr:hypothetical protein [Chroococcidiopsidaceae cyanobacterium CP_BM_ER_R8_30]